MRARHLILALAIFLTGCQLELRLDPRVAAALNKVALMPNRSGGAPPKVYYALGKHYEINA